MDEKHPLLGGKGTISTPDGYTFKLSYSAGLAYINMRKFDAEEYANLPHVIMTSDKEWDPTVLDNQLGDTLLGEDLPDDLHKLPHQDYGLTGDYVHEHNFESLAVNGHAEFTSLHCSENDCHGKKPSRNHAILRSSL